ncbi:hypothetical protein AP219_16955, partial [Escherichia coli]|uniref:hypothetical protein n=1 Tax=Escherichia coli TaxID=562 RepID=UPI00091E402C
SHVFHYLISLSAIFFILIDFLSFIFLFCFFFFLENRPHKNITTSFFGGGLSFEKETDKKSEIFFFF